MLFLFNNKIQLSTIVNNWAPWLIYFTISNLNHKTKWQYRRASKFLLSLIPIHKRDNEDVKLDIYYIYLRIMIKYKQNLINLAFNAKK